jgi:hypothetical protein
MSTVFLMRGKEKRFGGKILIAVLIKIVAREYRFFIIKAFERLMSN